MRVVLGIDPGSVTCGLAAVRDDTLALVWHRCVKFADSEDLLYAIDEIENMNFSEAAIEDQYLQHITKGTVKFIQSAGFWHGVCTVFGMSVVKVSPKVWQRAELDAMPRDRRETLKARAVSRCRGLWHVELKPDVADAALIARYWAIGGKK